MEKVTGKKKGAVEKGVVPAAAEEGDDVREVPAEVLLPRAAILDNPALRLPSTPASLLAHSTRPTLTRGPRRPSSRRHLPRAALPVPTTHHPLSSPDSAHR